MKYLILIILLSGCSSIPSTHPVMFDIHKPDLTQSHNWGLTEQRLQLYNEELKWK